MNNRFYPLVTAFMMIAVLILGFSVGTLWKKQASSNLALCGDNESRLLAQMGKEYAVYEDWTVSHVAQQFIELGSYEIRNGGVLMATIDVYSEGSMRVRFAPQAGNEVPLTVLQNTYYSEVQVGSLYFNVHPFCPEGPTVSVAR